jgi:NitT/TauT family transport system substrate-binding protein
MSDIHVMSLRHSAFYSPLLVAFAGGYLRDEGLDASYEIASRDHPIPGALAAGMCHVAQSAVSMSFDVLERGEFPDIVHFAQLNERDGFFLVGREPQPDFAWRLLRGKRILVDHLFQPLAMFRYALDRHGLDLSAVEVVDAGQPDEMEAAFRDGAGDYVHLQGPAAQQLEGDGIGHVVAAVGESIGPVAFSSLCARREWLVTDAARAFVRAYRRAREHVIQSPPGEIAAVLQEGGFFTDVDRRVLAHTVRAYQHLGCWSPGVEISRASYEHLLDVFEFSGLITRRHPYGAAVVAPPE